MEIIRANIARQKTIEAIEAKHASMLKMINDRILMTAANGKFECNFTIESSTLQNELFDYLTSHNYIVRFFQQERVTLKYGSNARIMTVSWENAII